MDYTNYDAKKTLSSELEYFLYLATINYVLDIFAVSFILIAIRNINLNNTSNSIVIVFVVGITVYILFILSVSLFYTLYYRVLQSIFSDNEQFSSVLVYTFRRLILHPWRSGWLAGAGKVDLSFFSIGVGLPLTAYAVVMTLMLLAYVSRPVTQGPLSLVVQRMESSKTGICTMIAGAVSAIVAVITAWQKYTS